MWRVINSEASCDVGITVTAGRGTKMARSASRFFSEHSELAMKGRHVANEFCFGEFELVLIILLWERAENQPALPISGSATIFISGYAHRLENFWMYVNGHECIYWSKLRVSPGNPRSLRECSLSYGAGWKFVRQHEVLVRTQKDVERNLTLRIPVVETLSHQYSYLTLAKPSVSNGGPV